MAERVMQAVAKRKRKGGLCSQRMQDTTRVVENNWTWTVVHCSQRQGTGAGGCGEEGKTAKQGSRGRRSRVVWVHEASAQQGC